MNSDQRSTGDAGEDGRWPVAIAASLFLLALGGLALFHPELYGASAAPVLRSVGPATLLIGLLPLGAALAGWLRSASVVAAAPLETATVRPIERVGMIAFIASEAMFFAGFFAAYLRFAADPSLAGLTSWPPAEMRPADPWGGPLLNTVILLASGAAVAVAHDASLKARRQAAIAGLAVAVLLGAAFLGLQVREFLLANLSFRDGVYPSIFFLATGFHGLHVLIGATLLAICLARITVRKTVSEQGYLFEASAWYWHFVDVVWLFLFAIFYAWGG